MPRLRMIATALLLALTAASPLLAETNAESPAVIAVKFHADWCGSCKAMGPVFEELQAKYDTQPVLFVTFDFTHEFDRRQSAYLAHSMGLDKIWKANGGKTGSIWLIDASSKKVLAKLTREHNLKQMGAALMEAIDKASR